MERERDNEALVRARKELEVRNRGTNEEALCFTGSRRRANGDVVGSGWGRFDIISDVSKGGKKHTRGDR